MRSNNKKKRNTRSQTPYLLLPPKIIHVSLATKSLSHFLLGQNVVRRGEFAAASRKRKTRHPDNHVQRNGKAHGGVNLPVCVCVCVIWNQSKATHSRCDRGESCRRHRRRMCRAHAKKKQKSKSEIACKRSNAEQGRRSSSQQPNPILHLVALPCSAGGRGSGSEAPRARAAR